MSILRLLADTARIKNGKIEFEGTDLTKVSDKQMREIRGQKIAMVFQDPMSSLNPLIPVGKQVAEMIHVHHPEMKRDELQAAHAGAVPRSTYSRSRKAAEILPA